MHHIVADDWVRLNRLVFTCLILRPILQLRSLNPGRKKNQTAQSGAHYKDDCDTPVHWHPLELIVAAHQLWNRNSTVPHCVHWR